MDQTTKTRNLRLTTNGKITLILFACKMVLVPLNLSAEALPPADKAAHFAVSSLGVATTLRFCQWFHPEKKITVVSRFFASSLLLTIGFAKEIDDAKKNATTFDAEDMTANVGGIIYGNFLMVEF